MFCRTAERDDEVGWGAGPKFKLRMDWLDWLLDIKLASCAGWLVQINAFELPCQQY